MNKFDQHIKNKLSQPQIPSLEAWKNIEQKLDHQKSKKRTVFIWFSSSAACLILLISFFFIYDSDKNTETINLVNINARKKEVEDINIKQSTVKEIVSSASIIEPKLNKQRNNKEITRKESINQIETVSFDNNINNNSFIISSTKDSEKNQESNSNIKIEKDILASNSSNKIITQKSQIIEEEPSIEDILKNNEKKEVEVLKKLDNTSKLIVSSFVSPLKMVGQKSILSNSFNSSDIENNLTFAYGAKIAYQLNDKLSLRTGISKIEIDQVTNNITTTPAMMFSSQVSSNGYEDKSNNIRYSDPNVIVLSHSENFPSAFYKSESSKLNQVVKFVEIPLELEYKLLSKNKFNLSAVGGASYLVLTKNELSVQSSSSDKSKIGEATNISSNSFGTNAGIKAEYKLNSKLKLQLEPNYKLLLSPINNIENNTSSIFGLNFGLSFTIK